jgi:hypothetical protein
VLNNWLADLTETTAETLSFTGRLGLDPASGHADDDLAAVYAAT